MVDNGALYVGIVSGVKIYSLSFQSQLVICINKFSNTSDFMVIGFYFDIKFKADVIDVPVLSFRCTLQA